MVQKVNPTQYAKVLAIDGPSGSGKSTLAKQTAQKLNFLYVDTGAMFRALALVFDAQGLEPQKIAADESKALAFLQSLKIDYAPQKHILISINGEDLTLGIRQHRVSALASQYSQMAFVRTFLLDFQRKLAKEKFCVMEGRDIGTVVFPNAFCKIFLTASLEARAKRRFDELQALQGDNAPQFEKVMMDLKKRDESDAARALAPLSQASDAQALDSTALTPDEVLKRVVDLANKRSQSIWGKDLSSWSLKTEAP